MFVVDPVSSPGPPSGEAQKAAGKKDEIVHFAWHAGARISDLKRAQSPYHWTYIYIYIYIMYTHILCIIFTWRWAHSPLTNESLTRGWLSFWDVPLYTLSTLTPHKWELDQGLDKATKVLNAPNLPTKYIPTETRWLETSGNSLWTWEFHLLLLRLCLSKTLWIQISDLMHNFYTDAHAWFVSV